MRVINYRHNRPLKVEKKKPKILYIGMSIFALGFLGFFIFRVISSDSGTNLTISANQENSAVKGLNFDLTKPEITPAWPKAKQAAIGAVGYGIINEKNENSDPIPMASVAKVMPAIMIIEKDNLSLENSGQIIELTTQDVKLYDKYLSQLGAVTEIKPGEKISQVDIIKAMLINSSNNLADTAVIHSFGNVEEFLKLANKKAKDLGMQSTNFADATGFSPQTKSTASDLILLADYIMKNALFAEIVSTWQTKILGDDLLTNTNLFLDFENNNVVGIKSGVTDEAGGTFMGAARYKTESGDEVVGLAVVLGAKNHFLAQEQTMPLLQEVNKGFNSLP